MRNDMPAFDDLPANLICRAQSSGVRIRLGTNRQSREPVLWTPEALSTANLAVVGCPDSGCTQMLQSVSLQLLRQKARTGEPFGLLLIGGLEQDTDSPAAFADAAGARVLRLHKLALNPFSLRELPHNPKLNTHRAMQLADILARSCRLNTLQKSTLVQSIAGAYAARGITEDPQTWQLDAPNFDDVYQAYLSRPQNQHSEELTQVLNSLALLDLFSAEAQPDSAFYNMIRGAVILDFSGYPEAVKHFALEIILDTLSIQMRSRESVPSIQKMVCIDNADRLLSSHSPGLEALLTQGRRYGLGLMLGAGSTEVFRPGDFDYLPHIQTWILHNVEALKKADLELFLQLDLHDSALERLYQASRRLRKRHSLIRIGTGEPVLAEDLAFREIAGDTAQSYLEETPVLQDIPPLAGMPLLDSADPLTFVELDDLLPGPMVMLENL